jgi:hypothetical protein
VEGQFTFLMAAGLVVLSLALLDAAAILWGADSRDPVGDDHRR